MAQPGSAPALGAGGPRFESLYSDHYLSFFQCQLRSSLHGVLVTNDYVPVAQLDRAPAF